MFKEFKEFVARGNVLDLAVGIVIGAAFGKIVTSLVNDIIMPPIGLVLHSVNFKDLFVNLSPTAYATLAQAQAAGAPTINYGIFLNTILEFLIIAFAIFMVIKSVNRMRPKPAPAPVAVTTRDCPFCKMTIAIAATRCPHCTSDLQAAASRPR